ncbi:hypothetical protein ACFL0V_05775, partial [Nanoarchaeota archaeon]
EGKLHLVLEQKDAGYKKPFFDNGLNFLGGNWAKGKNDETSPAETVDREIREEFWQAYEAPESLNELLGQEFLEREPQVSAQYDQASVNRIQTMAALLRSGIEHAGDYIVTVRPPITNDALVYGSSIFAKELTADELHEVNTLVDQFGGKLTTDNLKWNSQIAVATLDDINLANTKFSWGYDHTINHLLDSGALPEQDSRIIRPMNLISVEPLDYNSEQERTETGSPTYRGFERLGFKYRE